MGYTWAQFRTYLRLARKRRAQDQLLQAVAGNASKELIQSLQAEIKAADADA
jgi:hypothetical protein